MSEQHCPHCGTEMQVLGHRWTSENNADYIEYGCSHCGERVEILLEKSAELFDSDEYQDYLNDYDNRRDPIEEALANCGMMPDGFCSMAGTEYCDWKCAAREWFADDDALDVLDAEAERDAHTRHMEQERKDDMP